MTHPSEVTPAFTDERLQFIAATIAAVRADARDVHQEEKGDNAWSFGCLTYCRTCYAFARLAESGRHPWLRVEQAGLRFTLIVGGVALKFYRGDAEKPGERNLQKGLDAAITQTSLELEDATLGEWFWLLAIETRADGTVLRIAIFQATSGGSLRNQHIIDIDGSVPVVTALPRAGGEGMDLAPPKVGAKAPSTGEERRTGDGGTAANDVREADDDEPTDPEEE